MKFKYFHLFNVSFLPASSGIKRSCFRTYFFWLESESKDYEKYRNTLGEGRSVVSLNWGQINQQIGIRQTLEILNPEKQRMINSSLFCNRKKYLHIMSIHPTQNRKFQIWLQLIRKNFAWSMALLNVHFLLIFNYFYNCNSNMRRRIGPKASTIWCVIPHWNRHWSTNIRCRIQKIRLTVRSSKHFEHKYDVQKFNYACYTRGGKKIKNICTQNIRIF